MGVDTHIYFPPQTRLRDVSSVMATLLGHPTALMDHGSYQSCDVDAVTTCGIESMPTCARIELRDRDHEVYLSPLYQYESSGRPDSAGNTGEHVILLRATPLVIAMASALVRFLGGAVRFNDCDDVVNVDVPAPHAAAPEDGESWTAFERAKSAVKPLTVDDIEACRKFAAYDGGALTKCAPWLVQS